MRLDCLGMLCPWPALRLARALREASRDPITVLADDPGAPRELAEVARAAGWKLIEIDVDRYEFLAQPATP